DLKLKNFRKELIKQINFYSKCYSIDFKIKELVNFKSVKFNQKINNIIKKNVLKNKFSHMNIYSGAGHDAQMLSKICSTSMIFIPSLRGISHDKKEDTKKQQILNGLRLLLNVTEDLLKIN
ncbi:MAG: Allantoate amidohydrolase, partial [Alphaproteobacteria bacterium MarineAlpha5_Bin8]